MKKWKKSLIFLWWIVELDSVGDTTLILETLSTGYSFWDWLCNFLHKFTWIVLSVHKLNKLGKFWQIYGQLLNIMSSYGWYEKVLRRSHNYQPV